MARALGVCDRTVRKWVARAAEGELALEDRSCRPHYCPRAISTGLMVEMERLRRRWRWTGAQIAEAVGVSRATAARTLRQLGLARLGPGEAPPAGRRCEWERPGQLLHLDTPQYHGDPVQPNRGVLCYQEFGGDLLDRMREAGFADAAAIALR